MRDEDVFVCNGNPGQRTGQAGGPTRIGCLGLSQGQLGIHVNEGVQRPVLFNLFEAILREFSRAELLALKRCPQAGQARKRM